mmetsp:Transcript_20758/g.24550  ORF Transcript_20758/g.24550 Transcript_20758/m.24550 type:complete len:338 (-) Transcript_20758:282-1295(-)|eukprot:CAMPEP_0114337100 /NCGR_PEP_ID=MMETSP0101-20121206/6146_1 /TAXON_ID=38822 ORGANISM="Pteridomonas danica, Strain PT" /NCGR_SAMPLE_ID=MMETSP0101 /ASSEMBLY_ACC=CAM_ASM_000211 /LENGTH=337 /DNA_ID=CAMNT_0001469239 /DNA_START=30 /DNA_END=1043 /DNA_ORIENTATION=-
MAEFNEVIETAKADPNLASVTTIDELHARLKELSLELSEKDEENSPFKQIQFEGTNPNPTFTPNAYKANKGMDGKLISTYYRYAVKDEAVASKALGIKESKKSTDRTFNRGSSGGGSADGSMRSSVGSPTFGGARKGVTQLLDAIKQQDPELKVVDFSGQATFQMKPDEKLTELTLLLKENNIVTTLILKDCGISNSGAAILGEFLATNSTITNIDLSENKAIKEEGGVALANGLGTNTGLLELNLMGLGGSIAVKSEAICAAFITAFETNLTLKKPIWRLDHPLAHTLARLVTRNTSIARHIAQGKPFESLLPDPLKGTGVTIGGVPSTGGEAATE